MVTAVRKLDIGCGQNKTPGFKGIDLSSGADIKHDLFSFPWPIKANSVSEVVCNHFVEHIPHYIPGLEPGRDGWDYFWAEVYRICRKNATVKVVHPFARSERAFWDPTHVRYIEAVTWNYLSKQWREAQQIDHYVSQYDFEIIAMKRCGIPDDIAIGSMETKTFAFSRYWNVITELEVVLKVRK